ncbi:hypothetical protein HJG60_008757 [Phyllostomus discolor]|uniref:Uncharacterized protein n=1 Tax=Phyllostomus discolor TaxID=89673 RepID=A0A833YM51_9CHIR|nr:hypothetical protein HJG60_008757 [Phyllostomus discolor]
MDFVTNGDPGSGTQPPQEGPRCNFGPMVLGGPNQVSVLRSTSKSGQAERGESSGWKHLDFSLLASQSGGLTTTLPRMSSRPIRVPPLAPHPSLGAVHQQASSSFAPPPRCLLVPAEPWNVCSSRPILQPRVRIAPSLLLFVLFSSALFPRMDSDVEALARPLGSAVCTVFFA